MPIIKKFDKGTVGYLEVKGKKGIIKMTYEVYNDMPVLSLSKIYKKIIPLEIKVNDWGRNVEIWAVSEYFSEVPEGDMIPMYTPHITAYSSDLNKTDEQLVMSFPDLGLTIPLY